MREILTPNTTQSAVVVYPNVRHGFALDPNLPRHAADETADAFEQTSLFLKAHSRSASQPFP
jgi:dienelactone hydrolase